MDLAAAIAKAATSGADLESLTRPLLELLGDLTGLESTYLTEIHWDSGEQEVTLARNTGGLQIPEKLRVDWSDTLCRRALIDGPQYTKDVPGAFPGSQAAADLGLTTYVSVPVRDGDEVVGTLCGASGHAVDLEERAIAVMELFAKLIADQRRRDHEVEGERSRAEAAERRLAARAQFLAHAEHKLKSPLTAVLGWAETLEDEWDELPEGLRRDGVRTVRRAANRLYEQVEHMLAEAQAEVLVTELDIETVAAAPVLEQVVTELVEPCRNHVGRVDVAADVYVEADVVAVWQVLSHLVENSLKYSPDGGAISLAARRVAGEVVFDVVDEGVGVPEGVDVFAPFTRGDFDQTAGTSGSGLGLHIVRNLVEGMAGEVSCRRNEGRGSTFSFSLPAAAAPVVQPGRACSLLAA